MFWGLEEDGCNPFFCFWQSLTSCINFHNGCKSSKITWNFCANDDSVILENSADKHQCMRHAICINNLRSIAGFLIGKQLLQTYLLCESLRG